jgi:hypothetical protein
MFSISSGFGFSYPQRVPCNDCMTN